MPIPNIAVILHTIFPNDVIGVISPYPTDVKVIIEKYMHFGIEENTCGCALYSAKYINIADNNIETANIENVITSL